MYIGKIPDTKIAQVRTPCEDFPKRSMGERGCREFRVDALIGFNTKVL